jgi:hypothetical protein
MILFLLWTGAMVFGSLFANREKFVEYMEVKRYRAFITMFPDHPVAQWHDEERAERIYSRKKDAVKGAIVLAAWLLLWPISIPAMIFMEVKDRLDEKNQKMTYATAPLDLDKIREEEGIVR